MMMETVAIPAKLDICSILTPLTVGKTPYQACLLDTPIARAVCTHDCPRYTSQHLIVRRYKKESVK